MVQVPATRTSFRLRVWVYEWLIHFSPQLNRVFSYTQNSQRVTVWVGWLFSTCKENCSTAYKMWIDILTVYEFSIHRGSTDNTQIHNTQSYRQYRLLYLSFFFVDVFECIIIEFLHAIFCLLFSALCHTLKQKLNTHIQKSDDNDRITLHCVRTHTFSWKLLFLRPCKCSSSLHRYLH